jgi:hypothetical protein
MTWQNRKAYASKKSNHLLKYETAREGKPRHLAGHSQRSKPAKEYFLLVKVRQIY